MAPWIAVIVLLIGFGIVALLRRFCTVDWFTRNRPLQSNGIRWEDKGPVPLSEKGFTPQGLAWAEGKLIFANSWKNKRSRVYEFDPQSMTIERWFDMPPEAVHTSGLAWDGSHLWAVDYISHRAYSLGLEQSFSAGEPKIRASFATGLRGTSACCTIPWQGKPHLAISDFNCSRTTIIVDLETALEQGTTSNAVVFRYHNESFSQGLEYIDGYLYESENKWGKDIVNKMSLEKLAETASARRATVAQFAAPGPGVEDIAWDGKHLWTSDEKVFRFYRGTIG